MNEKSNEGQGVNLLDLLVYLASKWRWFTLSVAACCGLAWLHYARTPLTYFRSATVIIKDPSNKTTSTAGLDRYDNIINKVNVANEILQFRSKTLMREVVQRLHADISYKVRDGLRDIELYSRSPVTVNFPDARPESSCKLQVKVIDKTKAEVTWLAPGGKKTYSVPFNRTVRMPGGRMTIVPTDYCSEAWYGQTVDVAKMPLSAMAAHYSGMLGIRQEEDESSILTLSLKDNSPERAEDVLNTLITVYNEDAVNDKNQVAVNTANFINERLIIIERELGGVESDLEAFKRSNELVDIGSMAGRYMGESQKYSADAIELETQLRLARYIKDYLTDPLKEKDLIPANTGIRDMDLEGQIGQYNAMRLRRDKLVADSSEENPVVEELNNSLRSLRQTIIRAVDNYIVSVNVRRNDAQNYEMRAQARVQSIPRKERQMLSIERQQKIKESLYIFLLNRREENALSQAMADNNARTIDSVGGPAGPIAPDRNRTLLLGLLAGLAMPAAYFLMLLFMDTRVHSRKDLQGVLSVPFLGEVPLNRGERRRRGKATPGDGGEEGGHSHAVDEAMRILRTNMAFLSRRDRQIQVITFTSFNEGAGKTFTVRNLAMSYACAKKRVVLVDLDLRKATLSRAFTDSRVGVSNYLADDTLTIDDVLQRSADGKQPDIVPAGAIAPNPAELLMDRRLDMLFQELRQRYDIVIADGVPTGIIADSAIANRVADITVFVVRAGKLDRRQLPDIEALYQEQKLRNMAVVLNGIDLRRWGYRYGYGYGYGYGGYGRYGQYGYGYGKPPKENQ